VKTKLDAGTAGETNRKPKSGKQKRVAVDTKSWEKKGGFKAIAHAIGKKGGPGRSGWNQGGGGVIPARAWVGENQETVKKGIGPHCRFDPHSGVGGGGDKSKKKEEDEPGDAAEA